MIGLEKIIYTIGTSNREAEEFIRLLKAFKIEVTADIRRFPTSKFAYFKRENLESALGEKKIEYVYLGRELGGYRKGGYPEHMKTELFQKGLNRLITLAESKRLVLVCSERLPWKCHRRYVGRQLEKKGFRVIHIIEKDRSWEEKK